MTPASFKGSYFYLGRFRRPMYLATFLFNGLIFAVMISPFYFPVDAQSFNFAVVIFGAVTIFALVSYWFIPAEKWLRQEQIVQTMETAEGVDVLEGTEDFTEGTYVHPHVE
ncbi:hypothetical protein EWM64_g10880 [Hericium alpestre]|uniref:Uncharacterized protein n=1 Tax=Hericium alpestre TaxID=135208 RepID=A0A4Y9ZH29_9AGAM|nr:hypothetical protein EWM64_g10880 [Hericium alpestre]